MNSQRSFKKQIFLKTVIIILLCFFNNFRSVSQDNSHYTVQLNTIIESHPPGFRFVWNEDPDAEFYKIYKRENVASAWGNPIAILDSSATHFTDFDVEPGHAFEYGFFKTPSWISDTVQATPGSQLTFTIYDSWGDGICCGIGFGYYKVFMNDSLIVSGGDFGFSESTSFTIPGDYPPNTKVVIQVYFDNLPDETTWVLHNNSLGIAIASGGPYSEHHFTFIRAGIDCAAVEYRGKILLVIDNFLIPDLNDELDVLQTDLIGDGWKVNRLYVDRTDNVPAVKQSIIDEYNADTSIKSLFLIGHIPVPYSGEIAMDGHPDHLGAWPSDLYYADMDGTWTDMYVDNTEAFRPENHNVPGDGKFDQSFIPSDIELQIGRLDLSNLPAFNESEIELMEKYLSKNHQYRHGNFNVVHRGLIDENLSQTRHAVGWRNFAALVGAVNTSAEEYLPTLENESYLWSFGCGGSGYTSCGGVASTVDFATKHINTVFTLLFGSYFGDWNNPNNVLRSPLGADGMILANMWACVPHWYLHPMGLGETIGYCTKLTQNNGTEYIAFWGSRIVHTALMGDPTLRMHTVKPVSGLSIDTTILSTVYLSWLAPDDSINGYNIYRSDNLNGDFVKINEQVVIDNYFNDPVPLNGKNIYMVRAIKLQQSASGSYYNLSQGMIGSVHLSTVGINNGTLQNNNCIRIFPNPAKEFIYIKLSHLSSKYLTIEIADISGRIIMEKDIYVEQSTHVELINLHSYPNGIYRIHIVGENCCVAKLFSIQ